LPELPATIAVHWGPEGAPDGFAPAWTQPLATALLGLGLPLLMALPSLPGLRGGDAGATYRLMGAIAAGTSVLVTVALTWTLAMQAGLDSAAATPPVWVPLGVSLVAGLAAGVAAWFIQPSQRTADAATPAAAPLALGPTERALWLRSTAMVPGAAVAITVAVVLVTLAVVVAWVTGVAAGVTWLLTGVALVLLVLAGTTVAFHVRVDETGLHVDSVLGIPRFHVPLDDVEAAARVHVDPMGEFGGWGARLGTGRRFGIVLRAGEALEVTRRSGRRFVVTVSDAQTAAALLQALVARRAAV
jgi:hypothetical protein